MGSQCISWSTSARPPPCLKCSSTQPNKALAKYPVINGYIEPGTDNHYAPGRCQNGNQFETLPPRTPGSDDYYTCMDANGSNEDDDGSFRVWLSTIWKWLYIMFLYIAFSSGHYRKNAPRINIFLHWLLKIKIVPSPFFISLWNDQRWMPKYYFHWLEIRF